MSKTSALTVGVTVSGDGETATYVAPGGPFENTSAPNGGTVYQALTGGDDTITLPTGAVGVVIAPPAAALLSLTLKGVAGDTGRDLRLGFPAVIYFEASVTTFVLNAGAAGSVNLHWL